jgi:hypothetical protein
MLNIEQGMLNIERKALAQIEPVSFFKLSRVQTRVNLKKIKAKAGNSY